MRQQTKTDYYLLILLSAIAAIIIFPVLGRVELSADELLLANLSHKFTSSGISSVFDGQGDDFPGNFYAYLCSVTMNLFGLSDKYAVRLPSAIIVMMLTLGLFEFRNKDEKPSKSFLAALLFLSSYTVSASAYHANQTTIMSLFFIFALSSAYHWLKLPSRNKAYLTMLTTACATIFMGILVPVAICLTGYIFMLLQGNMKFSKFLKYTAISATGTVIAYLTVIFITNDTTSAQNVLGVSQITAPLEQYGKLVTFAGHLFFSIFPWSVPIIIALFWIIANPSWFRNKFLALTLFKQFGVILFAISIPTFFALNRLSIIMLLASIYFNMPIISSFLLSQIHNHSITWRITGGIFASATGCMTLLLAAIAFGADITVCGYGLSDNYYWSFWTTAIAILIFICIYTLWRNQRTIHFNNRYLYNIVILYLLAQLLYKAYINPFLTTSI